MFNYSLCGENESTLTAVQSCMSETVTDVEMEVLEGDGVAEDDDSPKSRTDIASYSDEKSKTEGQDVCEASSCEPTSIGSGNESIEARLKKAFDGLIGRSSDDQFVNTVEKEGVVVSLDNLLALFTGRCNEKGCEGEKDVWHRIDGGVVIVGWNCGRGHGGVWESSEVLATKQNGQKVFVNTVVLAASVLISGNNFSKAAMFSKCSNLQFVSVSTFHRIQKLYGIPAINSFWGEMQKEMEGVFEKEKLVLAGDGGNDSPGHCAQYCVYSLMEDSTKTIVDVEIKDCRQTGGSSPAMEVAALKVLLERLLKKFNIGELTTDASTTVIPMVKKLKGIFFA